MQNFGPLASTVLKMNSLENYIWVRKMDENRRFCPNLTEKWPKTGEKLIFFRKILEITKYHQITCLCEISCQLEHFWPQNGNFRLFWVQFQPYYYIRDLADLSNLCRKRKYITSRFGEYLGTTRIFLHAVTCVGKLRFWAIRQE